MKYNLLREVLALLVFTQPVLVDVYKCFGTANRFLLQGSSSLRINLKMQFFCKFMLHYTFLCGNILLVSVHVIYPYAFWQAAHKPKLILPDVSRKFYGTHDWMCSDMIFWVTKLSANTIVVMEHYHIFHETFGIKIHKTRI